MKYANLPPNKRIGKWVWNEQAELGAGAFGRVFLGHPDDNKNENVAIKQMDLANIPDMSLLENELMVLGALTGPHTCGLLDQARTTRNQYIVQRFCNGGDLRSLLTKRGRIPEQEALPILNDILKGFQEMVQNDFAHRDVKPENTLIHDNRYMVADFGFACRTMGRMMTQQCGTPLYMSPAIHQGQPYSMKNDIWAVGLIYYEMLCGKTPWDVRTAQDLIEMPRRVPLKFPYGVNISEMSKQFLRGCLAYEERNRWSWQKIFSDRIFTNYHHTMHVGSSREIDQVAQRFITNLQNIISQEGLSLDQIFANFDRQGDRALDAQEFTRIIQAIDGSCQGQVCHQVFQHLDPNNDGLVSYKEFYELLQTCFEDDQTPNVHLVKARCDRVLKNLVHRIYQENLSMGDILVQFDQNRDSLLNPNEFFNLLRTLDPQIHANESYYLFNMFDRDGSGSIQLNEFAQLIQDRLAQIQQPHFQQNHSSPVHRLRQIIRSNNINLQWVLNYFDYDRNQVFDYNEFAQFVMALDQRISPQMITNLFQSLSANKQFLTMNEINALL